MKNVTEKSRGDLAFLKGFLLISPFFVGGYYVWSAGLMALVLGGYIVYKYYKSRAQEKLSLSVTLVSLLLLPVAYLAVCLWSVDKTMAVYGFVKLLPVGFFALAVSGLENKDRQELLDTVPLSGAVMGVVSYALSFIPLFGEYFLVAERLGGFFQSPNAFAAYCLAGLTVVMLKEKLTYKSWLLAAVLTAIIFLTGSRTVFVFFVAVILMLLFRLSKKNRIRLALFALVALGVSLIVVVATDSVQTVGRYLTISLDSSTLNGRLLYYLDALKVIIKNPFGLGYYGYYFSQGSFQTGVYSTVFVHNGILQLLIDIGWIPALLFANVVCANFCSKDISSVQRAVLFVIFGHSMFDFDLQFISVFFVLILTLSFEGKKNYSLKVMKAPLALSAIGGVLVALWLSVANIFYLTGGYDTAVKIYGGDTMSKLSLMTQSEDYGEIEAYADSILKNNKSLSLPYSAKANIAYMQGEVMLMLDYKEKAVSCSRYSSEEYNDYFEKAITVATLYRNSGDRESAEYCNGRILAMYKNIQRLEEKTSPLAYKLKDSPEIKIDDKHIRYIRTIR